MKRLLRALRSALLMVATAFAAAATGWVASQRSGDVAHFLTEAPPAIRRFDLAGGGWLAPLPLKAVPTAFLVEPDALYVAFGTHLVRYTPDLAVETPLLQTGAAIQTLLAWSNYVYAVHPDYPYGHVTSVRKSDATVMARGEFIYKAFVGASLSVPLGRIYGRQSGIFPSDIDTLPLRGDGTFGNPTDSPYHGTYPDARQTYVLGDGSRVADDSGTVYEGDTLAYAGSFGGTVDALAIHGGSAPIVLRGQQVLAFSPAFLPTGGVTSSLAGPKALFVQGTNVLVFAPSADGIASESIPLAALKPEEPGEALDPHGLDYTPDVILREASGDLLLHSRSLRSLFRWSRSSRDYAPTLPLVGTPSQVAYSAAGDRVYLGFDSGRIDRLELGGSPVQTPFVGAGAAVLGLAVADPYLFVCNAAGPWVTHETYGTNGNRISSRAWSQFSREYVWSPADRRVYHFRDDISPNDLLAERIELDGQLGAQSETPYHGEVAAVPPIRVSPDARWVLLGSGEFYEGAGLTKAGTLPVTLADAAWHGTNLYTVRTVAGTTLVQGWSTNGHALLATRPVAGSPLRMFADAQGVTLVMLQGGRPRFHLLGPDLSPVFSSPVAPVAPTDLRVSEVFPDSVTLTWRDLSDNEDGFEVEALGPVDGEWRRIATAPADAVRWTVGGLPFASTQVFRIRAVNGAGASGYAGPVTVVTLPDPRGPAPARDLTLVEASSTRVELAWTDAASNEDGYRVERASWVFPGPTLAWVPVATLPANATRHVDSGLSPGGVYSYRVVAFNAFTEAAPSAAVTAYMPLRDDVPPQPGPGILQVALMQGTEVRLAWPDVASNEAGFRVERVRLPAGAWEVLGTVGRNATNFTDAAVLPGRLYGYRVTAFNAYGSADMPGYAEVLIPSAGGRYLGLAARMGSITCFAFEAPDRVERYDTATGQWLAPIPLVARPTALAPSPEGLYVAFGGSVVRVGWDPPVETPLVDLPAPVVALVVSPDLLYVFSGANRLSWVDRRTGLPSGEATLNAIPSASRVAMAPDGLTTFVVSQGIQPAGLYRVQLSQTGGVLGTTDGPHRGSLPIGAWAAVAPDGQRVVTSGGVVFQGADLRYVGSLAGALDTVAFGADGAAVVARGSVLSAHDPQLRETGLKDLGSPPAWIDIDGSDVLAYQPDVASSHGFEVQRIPRSSLRPPEVPAPPSFAGLVFRPDDAFLASDRDTLVLFSAEHHALFRWSLSGRMELPGIGLRGAPLHVAYSAASNRVYTAYPSGQVLQVDLAPGAVETPFAALPQRPLGLVVAGSRVVASAYTGSGSFHHVFGADGTLSGVREWNHASRQYAWSGVRRRVYFFRDGIVPNDLHWEAIDADGAIPDAGESPYHGEVDAQVPIRLKADGSAVLLGSGQVLDASTLTFTGMLPNPVVDGAWRTNSLLTVRDADGGTQVQRWSPTYSLMGARQLGGQPLRLWPAAQGTVVLTLEAGQPRVTLLGDDLEVTYQSPVNHPPNAIQLTPGFVGEDLAVGGVVGTLTASDPDVDESFTFSLVGGATGSFAVDGALLRTMQPLDFETQGTMSLIVRVVDRGGKAFEQPLSITVRDVNEAPTGVVLSGDILREEAPVGALVGMVSVLDPDVGDRHGLVLTDSADGQFRLVGRRLEVARRLSFRASPRPVVRIQATDVAGARVESSLVIQVLELPSPSAEVRVLGEGQDRLMVLDVVQPRLAYGMVYEARMSTDLQQWQPLLLPPTLVASDDIAATVRYVLSAASGQRYLRVRAVYP